MPRPLRTRINASGYQEYWDPNERRWRLVHRRVVEKKLGGAIPPEYEVHHIDEDKQNNRPQNLTAVAPEVHDVLHHEDDEACFRCGRSGHWASECYARTTVAGRPLGDDDDDDDDEWDDDDDDE